LDPDRERHAATVAAVRGALGDAWAAEYGRGAALDPAGALAIAADAAPQQPTATASPAVTATVRRASAPSDADSGAPVPAPATPALATAPAAVPGRVTAGRVDVRVFGPLLVTRDGAAVPPGELTPAKVRELLLYLALHPGGRTKEQAALALWPDASPAQVRNAFHVTLHQLRRALGRKEAVTFDAGTYALARPADGCAARVGEGAGGGVAVGCDVDAVRAAAAAVRAADLAAERGGARGPDALDALGADADALARWRAALDGARRGALGEGEDAGEWLAAEQARAGAAWADGMEALARLHARRGARGEAAAVLEALVAAEPLREGAHRALMATYMAAGEPARALAHYDALAAHVAREVGAAPAAETAALAASIRRHQGAP
jgi:DNA-binding SARP family transcriptional activator